MAKFFESEEKRVLKRVSQILHCASELGEDPYKTLGRLEFLVDDYFEKVALLDNGDTIHS